MTIHPHEVYIRDRAATEVEQTTRGTHYDCYRELGENEQMPRTLGMSHRMIRTLRAENAKLRARLDMDARCVDLRRTIEALKWLLRHTEKERDSRIDVADARATVEAERRSRK